MKDMVLSGQQIFHTFISSGKKCQNSFSGSHGKILYLKVHVTENKLGT